MTRYHDIREQINSGDLILTRGRSWLARAIHWRTSSTFAHCGFAVWIEAAGRRRLCVLEAIQPHGVRLVPLSDVLHRDGSVDWFGLWCNANPPPADDLHRDEVERIDRDRLVGFALEHWGAPYAPWTQFARSWGFLARRLADWLRLEADIAPEAFHCAEYCLSALHAAGFQTSEFQHPAVLSPGEIARLKCFYPKERISLE